jgi:hypothetical protein
MFRNCTIAFVFATVSALTTTQAHAVQRTHVSAAIGNDINTAANCTPVAPCRTFQAAMTVTDVNGEVVVLDSGGYGAVTITQSVALIAPKGVHAGIAVFPSDQLGVFSDTPDINVVLRGLTINGQGGTGGIRFLFGNKLTVDNCVISNFTSGAGIFVSGAAIARVTNTTIRDNESGVLFQTGAHGTITHSTISGSSLDGVFVQGSVGGSITTVDIADSTIDGNGNGVNAISSPGSVAKVSVRDSRIVRNTLRGIAAQTTNGAASLSASNNIVSNNGATGILATGTGAKVWASGNTVNDNKFGLENVGAIFKTAGNNAVRNNATDTSGTIDNVGTK